ncbi:MAG: autoinducer binding domain-containing protein [Pseudomonadota bacterium]
MTISTLLKALYDADASEPLRPFLADLRDGFGITDLSFQTSGTPLPQMIATYPDAWQAHYHAHQYHLLDPAFLAASTGYTPIFWANLDWSHHSLVDFRRDAAAHDISQQGLSIPLHLADQHFVCLSATAPWDAQVWAVWAQQHLGELSLAAHYLTAWVAQPVARGTIVLSHALSPREVDALTYLGMGYSRSQLANALAISEHTVRAYIENARHKLGGRNTTHTVARAIDLGLIDIRKTGQTRVLPGPVSRTAIAGE